MTGIAWVLEILRQCFTATHIWNIGGFPFLSETLRKRRKLSAAPIYSGTACLRLSAGRNLYSGRDHQAVSYARQCGLNPRNLHAKNILIHNGRGYVVDVSDYMKEGKCYHFDMLKYVYDKLYVVFYRPGMKMPFWLLESIRRGYRLTISFWRRHMTNKHHHRLNKTRPDG